MKTYYKYSREIGISKTNLLMEGPVGETVSSCQRERKSGSWQVVSSRQRKRKSGSGEGGRYLVLTIEKERVKLGGGGN